MQRTVLRNFKIGRAQNIGGLRHHNRTVPKQVRFALKPSDAPTSTQEREVVVPDAVEEEGMEGSSLPKAPLNEPADGEEVGIEEMDPDSRRRRILVDIVNAGSALENEIMKYNEYLDEELLQLLYKRIETSSLYGEVQEVEGLVAIWRRLRTEVERMRSTPAMQLLDELLAMASPFEDTDEYSTLDVMSEATDYMMNAFLGPEAKPIDIFAVAKGLAEGNEPPEELVKTPVSRAAFVTEVKELLQQASQSTVEAKKELQSAKRKIRELGTQPEAESQKLIEEKVAMLRKKINERGLVMERVQQLLQIAESMSHIP